MNKSKIIVRSTSANLWWGIYGFCEKTGWEDLSLFFENEKRIGGICLNGRGYLRAGIDELRKDPEALEFVDAIQNYLADNKCHYWYYYNDKTDEDFYEVPYLAPINDNGVKPRFMEIWHPDEGIGLSTIESAIRTWVKQHLEIETCEIEIQNEESFEESLKSFKENEELFGRESKIEVRFADELIEELCQHWNKSKDEVLMKLESSIK